jgi:hypothetical protein
MSRLRLRYRIYDYWGRNSGEEAIEDFGAVVLRSLLNCDQLAGCSPSNH